MRRPEVFRHAVILSLAFMIAPGLASRLRAQHTPDPYNIVGEYNLGYQEYMYATYPNGIGFSPNQGILQGRSGLSRANQFQSYIETLDGVGGGSDPLFGSTSRGRGGIEPYYRAHREFDEAFNRVYAPNEAADRTYYQDQQSRTDKYLEYLRERDPKKRAQLYREYNQLSLRSARDFSPGSVRAGLRQGAAERSSSAVTPSPSTPPLPTTRGSTPSRTGTSLLRRPSGSSSTPLGTRGTRPAPGTGRSESPDQVLNRAEILERAIRATAPAAPPTRPAPR